MGVKVPGVAVENPADGAGADLWMESISSHGCGCGESRSTISNWCEESRFRVGVGMTASSCRRKINLIILCSSIQYSAE